MDHRNITESYRGISYFYRYTDKLQLGFVIYKKEIRIYLKNNNVYHPSFTSQIIIISNKNTPNPS